MFDMDIRSLIAEAEDWNFPSSQWELDAVKQLDVLPRHTVKRLAASQIEALGTLMKECHSNAKNIVARLGTDKARVVTGWLFAADGDRQGYFLHSVIELNNTLVCVSPWPENFPSSFELVIDTETVECDGKFYRGGIIIEVGLRRNPERFIEENNRYIESLKKMNIVN